MQQARKIWFAIFAYDKKDRKRKQLCLPTTFEVANYSLDTYRKQFWWCSFFKVRRLTQKELSDSENSKWIK